MSPVKATRWKKRRQISATPLSCFWKLRALRSWNNGFAERACQKYGENDRLEAYPTIFSQPLRHQMGFDHKRLTYRYSGRDFRLTDVQGRVVRDLIA